MSAAGMKKGSAYSPQIMGSKTGSPAPKTISRVMDSTEDCFAQRLQENESTFIYTGQRQQAKLAADEPDCELGIMNTFIL